MGTRAREKGPPKRAKELTGTRAKTKGSWKRGVGRRRVTVVVVVVVVVAVAVVCLLCGGVVGVFVPTIYIISYYHFITFSRYDDVKKVCL